MSLRYRDIVFRDFSGGISDNYVNVNPSRFEIGNNVYIKEDGSFETRFGSDCIYDAELSERIAYINDLNDDLIVVRGSLPYLFNEQAETLDQPVRPQASSSVWVNSSESYNISADEWQDHLIITHSGDSNGLNRPMKIYRDGSGDLQLRQLGMPEIDRGLFDSISLVGQTSSFFGWGSGVPSPNTYNYLYAFHWVTEYQEGERTRRVVGPVQISRLTSTATAIGGQAVRFEGPDFFDIMQLNTVNNTYPPNQYDASQSFLEVYRTVSDGTDFFRLNVRVNISGGGFGSPSDPFVDQVPVGAFNFVDSTADELIVNNEPLYISGGVLDRFQAPKAKYVKVINDTPYWAWIADETSGEEKPYRLIQGFAGIIDSHDPASFIDFDDEIIGISESSGFPIVFTGSKVKRIEGFFDNTGGGTVRGRTISDTAGCASHNSIVSASDRIFWIGDNAVYTTNGYNVEKIPATINLLKTIRSYVATDELRRNIVGTYDEDNERIKWAVRGDEWLILNLNTGGLTTASDASSESLHFANQKLYRGDNLGYIYKHEESILSDPIVDTTTNKNNWNKTHIDWLYKSVGIDYGDPSITNWLSHVTTKIQSDTNYGLEVGVDCDDGRVERYMAIIRSWGNLIWGDPAFVWGDPEFTWRKSTTIPHKRHTPRGTSRAKMRQFIMRPADVIIYKSDTYGTTDITYVDPNDPTEVNVTLADGWPEDIFNYNIAFDTDDYATQYKITNFTSNDIVLRGSITPATGVKWQISGKYKNGKVNVKAMTTRVASIDNEGREFSSDTAGGNE